MTPDRSTPDRVSGSPPARARADRTRERRTRPAGPNRRRFLHAAGSLAVAGLLAGCTDDGGTGGGNGPESVEEWLADASSYDGVADRTDASSVTVEVGPESDEMAFVPAAVRVSPRTTVTWQWVGSGRHNVVAADGLFDSGAAETRATFEYTFDAAGTTRYYCGPHRSAGMKGAAIVEESGDDESAGNGTE